MLIGSPLAKKNILWKLGKLNHVAIATPNMAKSMAFYKNVFGATVTDPKPQPEHGVSTSFIDLGNTKLELLHPFGDKSPISNFLAKNPMGGVHHICIEVNDIMLAMKTLKEHEIRVLNDEPKIGAHGLPVVFLHPKDCGGVLVSSSSFQLVVYS